MTKHTNNRNQNKVIGTLLSRLFFSSITLFVFNLFCYPQMKNEISTLSKIQTWHLLDYAQDTVYGMSVHKAYNELLKGKKSSPVIVAVIDEGIDTNQEDLKGHIWINTKEIGGNRKDDDRNGFVDDVHGWNFLGGKGGKMIYAESSEGDREYARLLPKYGSEKDSSQVANKKEYQYFLRAKKKHLDDSIARTLPDLQLFYQLIKSVRTFQGIMQKPQLYFEDVNSFEPKDSIGDTTKKFILNYFAQNHPDFKKLVLDSLIGDSWARSYISRLELQKSLYADLKPDPNKLRKERVGDNPFDLNDINYGNNIIDDSKHGGHGTHCSGVIAATRNNAIGMDGITDNVLIMMLRAVNTASYGDERDKDIALAIRYAADNGAKVISMSFGKSFSPQKQWVDEAVRYANIKGVLLVHAAGNNGANNDSLSYYPNHEFLDSLGRAENIINVGAISSDTGCTISTDFSNYGLKEVDVFAPGTNIFSTVPNNKYASWSGTSVAAPMVAGVAALILEYYPQLSNIQIKNIITRSVTSLKGKIVYKPGTQEKVDFATLCVSGGVVNAYKALQLADEMVSQ